MEHNRGTPEPPAAASRESLMPIVSSYFDKITPSQWALLGAGLLSADIEEILSDMIMDIIQRLCADLLRELFNTPTERISRAEIERALGNFAVQLEDSLEGVFAGALDVTREKCPSMENLAELVQGEVSHKIENIISKNDIWTEVFAVVSCSVSSTAILRRMVLHVSECLKKLIAKLNPTCMRLCSSPQNTATEESERCGSKLSVNAETSVCSLTDAVTDTLVQRSREDMTKEDTPTSMLQEDDEDDEDAEDAASEIVSTTLEDIRFLYPDSGSRTPRHDIEDFFLSPEDFLASHEQKKGQTRSPEEQKHGWFKLVRKQFDKMILSLKENLFKKEIPFLVDCSGSSEIRPPKTGDLENFDIPGTVPCKTDRDGSMISLRKGMSLPIDFALIKNHFERLFNKQNQREEPASSGCMSLTRNEVSRFSQDLTNKIYSHLVASQTCSISKAATGRRSLSDSVIYGVRRREDETHVYFSPELLYVVIEQSVGKFVESLKGGSINDEQVSGHLKITRQLSPPPRRSSVTTPVTPFDKQDEDTECPPTDKKSDNILVENEMKEVYADESAKLVQHKTRFLVNNLIFRLLNMASKRQLKTVQVEDVSIFTERLSEKIECEITIPSYSVEEMNRFNKAVINGVIEDFGSEKLAVRAAVLLECSILDDVILKNIRLHRICLHSIPPQEENPVNKFFSSMKKAMAKPFRRLAAMIFKD